MICTDNRVAKLSTMEVVEASLKEVGLEYEIYSGVSVEPTDVSFLEAIDFAKRGNLMAIWVLAVDPVWIP